MTQSGDARSLTVPRLPRLPLGFLRQGAGRECHQSTAPARSSGGPSQPMLDLVLQERRVLAQKKMIHQRKINQGFLQWLSEEFKLNILTRCNMLIFQRSLGSQLH